eukprot:scaffold10847_cov17-Tisochrysis_lutea.AAC.3
MACNAGHLGTQGHCPGQGHEQGSSSSSDFMMLECSNPNFLGKVSSSCAQTAQSLALMLAKKSSRVVPSMSSWLSHVMFCQPPDFIWTASSNDPAGQKQCFE